MVKPTLPAAAAALLLAAAAAAAQTPQPQAAKPQPAAGPEAPAPGEGGTVALRINWVERPDSTDVEKLRPAGFRDAAQVILRCRLNDPSRPADGRLHACAIQNEQPAGHGLGAAALSLVGRFRMDSKSYATMPEEALVAVPIRWRSLAPPLPARPSAFGGSVTGLDMIVRPSWLSTPTPDQIKAAKPAGKSGRAVVECTVATDTNVKDCRLIEESPLGAGLGEAALKLASLFRVSPMEGKDGKPQEAAVRIPFNFNPD
jgi:TonB family protein